MKGYLLDTAVALQGITAPDDLSRRIRKSVDEGPAFLSIISYWEVMIKSMKGKLEVGDARRWYYETLDILALQPLTLRPEHISTISTLPALHHDPFDCALIAQAIAEDLTFLTTDATIPKYASPQFRVIR